MNMYKLLGFLFVVFFGIVWLSQPTSVSAVDCGSIPTSGNYTVSSACSFPGTINGVDAGSGTTNSAVLTIGTGGTLTVLASQTVATGSLTMSGGSIAVIDTGTLKIGTPLYLPDADGDGYPTSVTTTQYMTAGVNRARRSAGADCNDASASVWQNLTGFADADLDGYTVAGSSQVCSGASLPSGYLASASSPTDANDAQYCPSGYNPAGTCNKCVNGAIANQTSSEDVFNECPATSCGVMMCSASGHTCTSLCATATKLSGNCNGSGACAAATACSCVSVGTDAGGTNGIWNRGWGNYPGCWIYGNCCAWGSQGCGSQCGSDGGGCDGYATTWSNCNCQ